jgi:hypothetical protein
MGQPTLKVLPVEPIVEKGIRALIMPISLSE